MRMTATPRPPTRASLASFGIAAVAALAGLAGWQAAKAPASDRTAAALAGVVPSAPAEGNMLRYDAEYPTIPYNTGPRTDAVAALIQRVERGEVVLDHHPVRGYLESLLEELDIDPASQTLVYSQTSLQSTLIRPARPRAIYFNDEVYVAFVQRGPLEIASVDPQLGPVFYLLDGSDSKPAFSAELGRCMACHDSYSLTGGGAPRFIVGSGYTGPTGALVSHEGWILISDRTPLKSRWGGWYVTGQHGDQVHLGNMQIKSLADFERLEELRLGNLETLDGLFDVEPYLTNKSDIVALLVLQHQADAQNLITRLSYDARTPAENQAELVAETTDRLVRMMLFAGAVEYTAPIAGDPAFAAQFASRAVRDERGRSLRDFDLNRRLFRYPLSYLIYSRAFDALPADAKSGFYARLDAVLTGADASEDFAHLTAEDRSTIRSILVDTKPDFAASIAN
jgi:hypothetical protein